MFVVSIVFLVFFPSLQNGFVNWDDDRYLLENPDLSLPFFSSVKAAFSSFYLGNYHPLTMLSYALEHRFFGMDPFVYHLTNLFLHALASLAALVFFRSLLGNRWVAWLSAAALFALHPLRVESVAWVSERKDVLCALFFIMALGAYVRYVKSGLCCRYRLACFCLFIAALLSKAMAVSLPVVLLLLDYVLGRKLSVQSVREKAGFFVLAFAFGLMALLAQHSAGAVRSGQTVTAGLASAPGAIVFYLGKSVFPVGLSCLYPNVRFAGHPWLPNLLANAAGLIVLAGLLWLSLRYTRMFVFGGLFFLVTLVPALQFVPLGPAYVADRYSYIPSLGLALSAALALDCLYRRMRTASGRLIFICSLAVLAAGLSVLTWERCRVWKGSISLWTDAVKKNRFNAVGFYNLGKAYEDRALFGLAVGAYQQAVRIKPDYEEALTNLCHSFLAQQQYAKALVYGQRALAINPQSFRAYYLIGKAYEGGGQGDLAVAAYRHALLYNPDDLEAGNSLAALLN